MAPRNDVHARLGVDPGRDAFTADEVSIPACPELGTPRRVLYRVRFYGEPVGWLTSASARDELARLNQMVVQKGI